MFLIHLKWRSISSFTNLMVQWFFSPNSTSPWLRLQKGRKITDGWRKTYVWTSGCCIIRSMLQKEIKSLTLSNWWNLPSSLIECFVGWLYILGGCRYYNFQISSFCRPGRLILLASILRADPNEMPQSMICGNTTRFPYCLVKKG